MNKADRVREIDENLEFFLREMQNFPVSANGKFALLKNKAVTGYYDTALDAVSAGNALYADRLFSIQQVTLASADLGYFSHALSMGPAQ